MHGVIVRSDQVDFTLLKQAQDEWERIKFSSFPLGEDSEDTDSFSESLRGHASDLKGPCAVALSAEQCLLRVVEFPTVDPDELLGMVEIQIDKFSPFPIEQLQITYEILHQTESRSRVLIVAVQQAKIHELGAAFREIGSQLHRIDVDAVCWWRLIEARGDFSTNGRSALLLTEPTSTTLIITQDGVPALFRSLGGEEDMGREAYCQMLAEETDYALTSMETEWGAADFIDYWIWCAEPPPTDLMDAIRSHSGLDVETRALDSLGPVSEGVARRGVEEQEGLLNLAPPEWEEDDSAAQTRKKLFVATGGLVVVWLLVVAVFMGLLGIQRSRLAQARADLDALEASAAEVKSIREKAQFVERYIDHTYSSLETLREISILMPKGVELHTMTFSKGGAIGIRGSAEQRSPIYSFQEGLQDSELFYDVKLGKVDEVKGKNVFRLSAQAGEKVL